MNTQQNNSKWGRWGLKDRHYILPDSQKFWSFLETALGPLPEAPPIVSPSDISIATPRFSNDDFKILKKIMEEDGITVASAERLAHALGKSYIDMLLISQSPQPGFKAHLGLWYIRCRRFDIRHSALLILIFEGSPRILSTEQREARSFAKICWPLSNR
jgi:hypothetical protein